MDMQKDSENKNLPKTDITAIPEQPQDAKADPENKDESDLQISSKQQKTDPVFPDPFCMPFCKKKLPRQNRSRELSR